MILQTIAFFNWQYPYGGGEIVTHNLASFFRSRNFRVILYTGKVADELLTDEDRALFEFRILPDGTNPALPENSNFICKSLEQEQVDCIIVQGVNSFPFAKVRSQTRCRTVFCLHNMPFWEVQAIRHRKVSELAHPTLGRKLEFLLLRKPLDNLTNRQYRRTCRYYARMLPDIDRLVLLCPEYKQDLERALRTSRFGTEFPPEKFEAILNPLLPVAPSETNSPKEKVVLYVGRLVNTHKRVDRLLKIWHNIESRNPDWRLIIVGTGEEEENLKHTADRLHLKNVEFAGYQTDMRPFYRRASFICLTSNFEGLPMSLMEGQQYGVIPVSFDSYAGIREITSNGKCGIMVPAFNLRKYTSILNSALADIELQKSLRTLSLEVSRKYELENIGNQWLRLFEKM